MWLLYIKLFIVEVVDVPEPNGAYTSTGTVDIMFSRYAIFIQMVFDQHWYQVDGCKKDQRSLKQTSYSPKCYYSLVGQVTCHSSDGQADDNCTNELGQVDIWFGQVLTPCYLSERRVLLKFHGNLWRRNSSVLTMELHLSCIGPSK